MTLLEQLEEQQKASNKIYGVERAEIEELKKIDLREYLLYFDGSNYKERKNGTIVKRGKEEIVIYGTYSFRFNTTVKHKRQDNIGTLQALYGWSFMEAINHLRQYRDKKEIPNYNKFD